MEPDTTVAELNLTTSAHVDDNMYDSDDFGPPIDIHGNELNAAPCNTASTMWIEKVTGITITQKTSLMHIADKIPIQFPCALER